MTEKKPVQTQNGTLRIKSVGLRIVVWKNGYWKKSNEKLLQTMDVIKLFKAHGNFDELVDKKNPAFLKGGLSPQGITVGARVAVLPDKTKLSGAYSLFAKNLAVHDQTSNDHWDVLYQNQNGGFAHIYSIKKIKKSVRQKYRTVKAFEKIYPKIRRKVLAALNDKNDPLCVPMYTLLTTFIRVGNEMYFKANGHKGLTTLKKSDISIKGPVVTFNFLSKGNVPVKISQEFPKIYLKRLKEILLPLKKNSFVFADGKTGRPLSDEHFRDAFKKYSGRQFYPHIVRSFYATTRAKEFLKTHKFATKDEVKSLFISIAEKLGHKKFVKKKNQWEDSYNVTIHHYIQPELVQRIENAEKAGLLRNGL